MIMRSGSGLRLLPVVLSLYAAGPSYCGNETTSSPGLKLVELGWDIPDTAFLRQHHESMEQEAPFDGVMFRALASDEQGRPVASDLSWNDTPWKREWFEPALADLKACRFAKFTDNFLRVNATPGNLRWEDDAGWEVLAAKIQICAWLTHEAGQKGIAIDFESYGEKQFQFKPESGRTFAEAAALVRRRGGQFMRALAHEHPNAVVLALWLNSINMDAGSVENPGTLLGRSDYGLLPAFIDGLLDEAPPTLTLVDGCELGYYLDGALAYESTARKMRSWSGPCAKLIAPENRGKWRTQVQAGFGFYLDMYLNEPGNKFYFGPEPGGTRLDRLSKNLRAARDASDCYVWVYGEQCKWWDAKVLAGESIAGTVGKGRRWEEAMPGLTSILEQARDPRAWALGQVARQKAAGILTNLVRNADFTSGSMSNPPVEFGTWQAEDSSGTMVWCEERGGGSARANAVRRGCFIQKTTAQPGELFFVQADAATSGTGCADIMVRWQNGDGNWVSTEKDVVVTFAGQGGDRQRAVGVVEVPADAAQLVLLLEVHGQLENTDVAWFDSAELYRLPQCPMGSVLSE